MSEFQLRHCVRDVLSRTSEADPGVLAGLVLDEIPADAREVALAQAMRLFVRQIISENRTAHHRGSSAPVHRSGQSVKVAAIRDNWQRRLHDRVHGADSQWKILADCTYEDLCAAANEREELAARNSAWAREYRAMASAVLDAGAETFSDLPVEQQAALLGGAS
ncbi:hypothetical protein RB608_11770 [Nocardioides sp. LHD-245]|uniref:hypothetical protein n=1 Tax=Nocardioides sp. LHD-245 TaxID=3051387 RepID=UPI0027E1B3FF|nr:hypothetical protein [Nocardioides sp. LHD-245]